MAQLLLEGMQCIDEMTMPELSTHLHDVGVAALKAWTQAGIA